MFNKYIVSIPILNSLLSNHQIIFHLAARTIANKYKGSLLGRLWLILTPIIMLMAYTVVFGYIFGSKLQYGNLEDNKANFAIMLYSGLIVHQYFMDIISSSLNILRENINFIKKIVFPLDALIWVNVLSNLVHFTINIIILTAFFIAINKSFPLGILYLPFLLIPMVILGCGISWFVSAISMYLRDLSQGINVISMVLLFSAPVFFTREVIPEKFRFIINLNPITTIVEEVRSFLISGQFNNGIWFMKYTIISILIAVLGYSYFHRSKEDFCFLA